MPDQPKPNVKTGRHMRSMKNILINPAYQIRYSFWLTLTGLVLVVMNAVVFYLFTSENYQILVGLAPMTQKSKYQLYKDLHKIIGVLVGGGSVLRRLFIRLVFC